MFQAIPSFEIGFGFTVELFIVVFSVLCWLASPETSKFSSKKEESNPSLTIDETRIKTLIESLNVSQLQKAIAKLKDLEAIPVTQTVRKKRKPQLLEMVLATVPRHQNGLLNILVELGVNVKTAG